MSRRQRIGWFLFRGFGPHGWGSPAWDWGYRWERPELYQQSARTLEQAGLDLLVIEDALSLGGRDTIDLRVREAYGGPKHDPFVLAPYLFRTTSRLGIAPTMNPAAWPAYLAARQTATLHHLSDSRLGLNVVTDTGSARHLGQEPLGHDAAYDRADEWTSALRELWGSWGDGALVEDVASGRYADAAAMSPARIAGEHVRAEGPLNAIPFPAGDPVIVSPGGSPRGLAYAGAHSSVQLALAPLDPEGLAAYRDRIRAAVAAAGRDPDSIVVLPVLKARIVDSTEEAERVVRASAAPDDAALARTASAWSSDLETDLTALDIDRPVAPETFGPHVSRGSIAGLFAGADPASSPLREVLTRRATLARPGDPGVRGITPIVGTAGEVADLIERLGEDGGSDGVLLSGDLHPSTVHRTLDALVPELRRRGVLRREYGDAGLRANLFDG